MRLPRNGLISGDAAYINQLDRPIDIIMAREIQASEAKTHLPRLLDEVERGETIIITRHGRPVARIVPETHRRQQEIDQAIEEIRQLQKRKGEMTVGEILSALHEGHKY